MPTQQYFESYIFLTGFNETKIDITAVPSMNTREKLVDMWFTKEL